MHLYCVMGNPVEHSRSPWIHSRFAQLTGQDINYTKRLIPLDGFAAGIAGFRAEGGLGCNITVPFKFEAGAVASRMSQRAQLAQAANVLTFTDAGIEADNTDGIGLVTDIEVNCAFPMAGRTLLLIGAGGAAAGVLGPLIAAGAAAITVANRTADKADQLVQRHRAVASAHHARLEAISLSDLNAGQARGFDVVINATASSMAGGGVPVAAHVLRPGSLAVDMMYGPAAAGFLAWAQAHGAVGRDGLGMLVEQAAEAFLIWRGIRPPSAQVLEELRARINQAE